MSKVQVKFLGQEIKYDCSEGPSYDHSRGKYYAFVKTNDGDKLVTSFYRSGLYEFTPEYVLQIASKVVGQ